MIRTAVVDDIPTLVDLGEVLHHESPRYSRLSYNREKVSNTLANVVGSEDALLLVAVDGAEIIGLAMAIIDQEWFSDDRVASEMSLFVRQDRRGSMTAAKLIAGMDAWAKAKGVPYIQAGASTGINAEQTVGLYECMGWTRCAIGVERTYN